MIISVAAYRTFLGCINGWRIVKRFGRIWVLARRSAAREECMIMPIFENSKGEEEWVGRNLKVEWESGEQATAIIRHPRTQSRFSLTSFSKVASLSTFHLKLAKSKYSIHQDMHGRFLTIHSITYEEHVRKWTIDKGKPQRVDKQTNYNLSNLLTKLYEKRIHGILPNLVVVTITVYWFTIFAGSSHVSHVCVYYIFFRWRFNVDHCFVRLILTCMQRIDGFATIPSSKKHTNHLKYSQQKEECVRETSVLKKKWGEELNSFLVNYTNF